MNAKLRTRTFRTKHYNRVHFGTRGRWLISRFCALRNIALINNRRDLIPMELL